MSKKPHKVEEAVTPCTPKGLVKGSATETKTEVADVRYMDDATFKKAADKIFATRGALLRRLAQ